MLTFLRAIAALVVLGVLAILAIIFVPQHRTPASELKVAADWTAPAGTDAGEYAARVADCAACHTAEGGKPFAGGRAIESPFGAIYSSNITSDPKAGIGGWTLDQFRAALVDGIGGHGQNLYPAMPYDNYAKLSEADIEAMYTYFTKKVAPVSTPAPETALAFPFNQRWGIRLWKWVGTPAAGFTPRFDDAKLDRGAYLVEGPGHCSACHSPRNPIMAQSGFTSQDKAFLTGGTIGGWTAPDLRGDHSAIAGWSADDLDLFLASGRNAHAGVSGEMKLAIEHSLQYLSDEDRADMVAYLQKIQTKSDVTAEAAVPTDVARADVIQKEDQDATTKLLASAKPDMPLGARLYLDNCAACHFVDGRGAGETFPQLKGNATVTAPQPTGLIDTILNGASMPATAKRPMELAMPGFGDRLSDDEVAQLASFLRQAWGNDAAAVKAADVAALRKAN